MFQIETKSWIKSIKKVGEVRIKKIGNEKKYMYLVQFCYEEEKIEITIGYTYEEKIADQSKEEIEYAIKDRKKATVNLL